MDDRRPLVTVIVPCYNEQDSITNLLEALYRQTFDHTRMEVVIADGLSTDLTRQRIAHFQRAHPSLCVRVVDNLEQTIPSGLNTALKASRGEYIVRLDAHCIPYPDYIERCIAALESGKGDNVGGVWEIKPGGPSRIASAIAAAAAHPLGAGDARYRLGGKAQIVDTVPFGAFSAALPSRIGYFDEGLLTNEDYEFNVRIRQSGGRIWMDPSIRSIYFARDSLAKLARQYWRYGYWKAQMLRRYPQTMRWRQLLPPVFVASIVIIGVLALLLPVLLWVWLGMVGLYLLALVVAGVHMAMKSRAGFYVIGLPLAITVMHFSWGSAFLFGLLSKPAR